MDVSLENDGLKIACEISVTSTGEQEIGNIQKCLAAGYDKVALISTEKKILSKVQDLAESRLEAESLKKVLFLTIEAFIAFLEETEAKAAGEVKTVKGIKVKVKYKAMGEDERKSRRQAISQVIINAVKRMKGKRQ